MSLRDQYTLETGHPVQKMKGTKKDHFYAKYVRWLENKIEPKLKRKSKKDLYDIVLVECGQQKISLIKIIYNATPHGLKESKDLAESTNVTILFDLNKRDAEEYLKEIQETGATARII